MAATIERKRQEETPTEQHAFAREIFMHMMAAEPGATTHQQIAMAKNAYQAAFTFEEERRRRAEGKTEYECERELTPEEKAAQPSPTFVVKPKNSRWR